MNAPPNEDEAREAPHGTTSIFPGMFPDPGSKPDANGRLAATGCMCSHAGSRHDALRELRNRSEYYFRKEFSDDRFRLIDGTDLALEKWSSGWRIEKDGQAIATGKGLPALLTYLFGVQEEIAFVSMIEAATGCAFDTEAVQGFAFTYREWLAAGRPERPTS